MKVTKITDVPGYDEYFERKSARENRSYYQFDHTTPIKVTLIFDPIFKKRTPSVKRIFEPSEELHAKIFDQDSGVFNDKTAATMTLADRSSWLHLWDAICCKSISPGEAYQAIAEKHVFIHLRVRASNYMHLV